MPRTGSMTGALALLCALACTQQHHEQASAREFAELSFALADGGVLAPSLAGTRLELLFGRASDVLALTLVAPDLAGTDGLTARLEGSFSPSSLTITTSHFEPLAHPELARGNVLAGFQARLLPDGRMELARSDGSSAVTAPGVERPNFVVIYSDDQRWDTSAHMPLTLARLAARGITFQNAFVTTPVCGPSRACLLSGGFLAQDTGSLTNGLPNGGFDSFDDTRSMVLSLRRAGYHTGFAGKYFNGYGAEAPYVPPGWNQFVANRSASDWTSFSIVEGTSDATATTGTTVGPITGYLTDYQAERALDFLAQHGQSPFFLLFSPDAPHDPATPAPGDAGLFDGYLYRERAYLESDRSDKPQWVQDSAPYDEAAGDEFHQHQLESLQALDRAVAALVDEVERQGRLDSTVFFFAGDNGFLWGEHGLAGKGVAYEESVRVPLIVAYGNGTARVDDHLVAPNLDIGATVLELAGLPPVTGGASLAPLLRGEPVAWRDELLLESPALGSNRPQLWTGLVLEHGPSLWKYIEHGSGERELYDLALDPYEESNVLADQAVLAADFAARLALQKGLAITTSSAGSASVGVPYELQPETWGGVAPFVWSLAEGTLPLGLGLDPDTGRISGTPAQAEDRTFTLAVESQALAAYTGQPQRFALVLRLVVQP